MCASGCDFTTLSAGLNVSLEDVASSGNANYGISLTNGATNLTITDSTFNNNPDKGFYTERLSYATFTNVQFNNSGNGRATQGAGLDLNLKYGAYSEIWLEGIQAVDSGKIGSTVNGSGISIAARNDGSYASNPATLELVTLLDAQVSGATMGIYLGGDITSSVTIRRSRQVLPGDVADAWRPRRLDPRRGRRHRRHPGGCR